MEVGGGGRREGGVGTRHKTRFLFLHINFITMRSKRTQSSLPKPNKEHGTDDTRPSGSRPRTRVTTWGNLSS